MGLSIKLLTASHAKTPAYTAKYPLLYTIITPILAHMQYYTYIKGTYMGTFDSIYLNKIKQLQEENKRLKQMINQLNINESGYGNAGTQEILDFLTPDLGDRRNRRLRGEYAKPLDDQEEMVLGQFPTGKTREGKGYLGSPEDTERRIKAGQRRAADEQKMKAAGFGDPRQGPASRPIPGY